MDLTELCSYITVQCRDCFSSVTMNLASNLVVFLEDNHRLVYLFLFVLFVCFILLDAKEKRFLHRPKSVAVQKSITDGYMDTLPKSCHLEAKAVNDIDNNVTPETANNINCS